MHKRRSHIYIGILIRTVGSNPFPQFSKTLRILSAKEMLAHIIIA